MLMMIVITFFDLDNDDERDNDDGDVDDDAACRHVMYEKRLDRLAWKIEYNAIEILDDGQLRQMISPGRPR